MSDLGAIHKFVIAIVAAIALIGIFVDWFKKASARSKLADRQSFGDEEFRRTFYAHDAELANTASRVRNVLARNLDISLDAVWPQDRLDELDVQLGVNPNLFAELESEFGIMTDYQDFESFEATTKRLATFSDLVAYVHDKRGQVSSAEGLRDASLPWTERVLELLDQLVPIAMVAGLIVGFLGSLFDVDASWRIGSGIFMLGIAYFIISFLVAGIDNLTTEFREQGVAWARNHPIRSVWVGFIIAVMVSFIFAMLWHIFRVIAGIE